jgi:nucleotide-binding universal stress UspA family protein
METIKMKKILIALDYNPTAQEVAEIGFSLAKTMNAEVILLHVISDKTYYSSSEYSPIMGFPGYVDIATLLLEGDDGIKKKSIQFLEKTKQHLGDENIQIIVEEGDFAETILKTANVLNADVVVMGSLSRKWLENIVLGSVTEKVLRHTTIPLFIIPTKQKK